jgi:hypothetical protein
MRCALHSSHVTGDFSSGRLEVRIAREDPRAGVTVVNDISFSVPPDFHAHNDLVAAALLTLLGRQYRVVSFNFPISARCATRLRDYYQLLDVGPVDEALEPRMPGQRIGVTFSGGLDSLATVVLLRQLMREPVVVITTDYGGAYAFEREGYGSVRQDLVCATDFRRKGYFRHGRFNFAVPLLYADYWALAGVATGNPFTQLPADLASLSDGAAPAFLGPARALQAGGLDELFIVRSLMTPALLRVLLVAAPQLLEFGFRGAGPPGGTKPYFKGLVLRCLCEADGRQPPAFLGALAVPTRTFRYGDELNNDLRALYLLRHGVVEPTRRLFPNLARQTLAFNTELRHTVQERYNTNVIAHAPPQLRQRMLTAFHACGIYPYDERDWHELDMLRRHVPSLRGLS